MNATNPANLGIYTEFTETRIAEISDWIDRWPENAKRDPEALTWRRIAKAGEESGEALGAWDTHTGGNPRKPAIPLSDVIDELLDTALAALGGVEHLTGNSGVALRMLFEKVSQVHKRAGLS